MPFLKSATFANVFHLFANYRVTQFYECAFCSVKGIFRLSDQAGVARLLECHREASAPFPRQIVSVLVGVSRSDWHTKTLRIRHALAFSQRLLARWQEQTRSTEPDGVANSIYALVLSLSF